MRRSRSANFTEFAKRLTPKEVAQHWFCRSANDAVETVWDYPDFPYPAPDGLYLLKDVEAWFNRYHGNIRDTADFVSADEKALRIARYGLSK